MIRIRFTNINRNKECPDQTYLLDNYMSFRAKGLLCLFHSFEDNAAVSIEALQTVAAETKGEIKSALRELRYLGYVKKKYLRDKSGHFTGIEYCITSKPLPRFISNAEKQQRGFSG